MRVGRGRAHSARHARVCRRPRLWRPQDGRLLTWKKKGGSAASLVSIAMFLTQSTVSARSARPSLHPASVRRRVETLRRAASQCHGPCDGRPMADRPGKAWKGPSCRRKGLRQAASYVLRAHADVHVRTCVCCSVFLCCCADVPVSAGHLCVSVCLSVFGCLFVRSFVLCVWLLCPVWFLFVACGCALRLCIIELG